MINHKMKLSIFSLNELSNTLSLFIYWFYNRDYPINLWDYYYIKKKYINTKLNNFLGGSLVMKNHWWELLLIKLLYFLLSIEYSSTINKGKKKEIMLKIKYSRSEI